MTEHLYDLDEDELPTIGYDHPTVTVEDPADADAQDEPYESL